MLKNLDYFLDYLDSADNHEPADATDLQFATAVVLVAAAFADRSFAPVEQQQVISALTTRLNVPRVQAESLIAEAQDKRNLQKLAECTAGLRDKLDVEERVNLLALTWKIIASDQVSTADENAFAVNLRQQLGLSMEQSLRARKISEMVAIDGFKEVVEASPEVVGATPLLYNKTRQGK
jgi:uncharacterized tellurite resistance protein B-like protein